VQGTTTLRARELDVHYVGGGDNLAGGNGATGEAATPVKTADTAANSGSSGGTQITKILAKGDVVITSENDQTTTSDWALYDVPAQLVTVGGNVVLTQGQNVLKGDRLVIDLKTGESRFDNTGDTEAGGRIRALFVPKQGAAGPGASRDEAAPDNAAPEAAPSGETPAAEPPSGKAADGTAAADDAAPEADGTATASGTAPETGTPAADAGPWQLVPEPQP
jgi:lipopolysaccharide export system protein LptA